MLGLARRVRIETERMTLRLPTHDDWRQWTEVRAASEGFLKPWEPVWSDQHLSRRNFSGRVYWAKRAEASGTALPLVMVRREDQRVVGSITLDNIRRGPAQAGTLGYWVGEAFARQGYMREAILGLVHHAFTRLDLSRIEAACLPENLASRGVPRLVNQICDYALVYAFTDGQDRIEAGLIEQVARDRRMNDNLKMVV